MVVAFAPADFAQDVNVRHKVHFDAALALTLTMFAAAAGDVKGKTACLVTALTRLGQHGIEIADMREDAGICGWIGTRRPSDGRLIDAYDFIDVLGA